MAAAVAALPAALASGARLLEALGHGAPRAAPDSALRQAKAAHPAARPRMPNRPPRPRALAPRP